MCCAQQPDRQDAPLDARGRATMEADMNSKQHGLLWLLTGLSGIVGQSGVEADEPPAGQTLYPAGSQQSFVGPEEFFTGDVHL